MRERNGRALTRKKLAHTGCLSRANDIGDRDRNLSEISGPFAFLPHPTMSVVDSKTAAPTQPSPPSSLGAGENATPAKISPPSSLGTSEEAHADSKTDELAAPPPKDAKFWLLFASLLLATLLAALDLSALATALPEIANDLQTREFTWIGTSYSVRPARI